jgi:hypothetical protein
MAKLNDLIVTIGAQTKQFDKALGSSMKKMQRFGMNTKKLGKSMTMGLTAPIAALGFTAVKAFDQQAKAIAQVEAGLKSTGATVGFTSKQLQQMASDLQTKTIFGDEEILKDATSQLLTFTNIAGDQFARTQSVALDLATRLDGDLKSASIQLGKALNDPIANLSALSRSGIQFSEDQKQVIKSLTESGRLAEAQTVILDELEKQYGGSAEAAAKAGTGGLKQLANSFGDLQEEFGKIIMEFLPPVIDGLKNMLATFQNLSPEVKRFMVIGAGIAAALGPLLVILPSLISGFMALLSPIGLVIAAVVGLGIAIVTFADEVAPYITDVINYFITLYNESSLLRGIIGGIKGTVQVVFDFFLFAVDAVIGAFTDLGAIISAVLSGDLSNIGDAISAAFTNAADRMADFGTKAAEDFTDAVNTELQRAPLELVTKETVANALSTLGGLTNLIPSAISGGGAGAADTGLQPLAAKGGTAGAPSPQLVNQSSTAVSDLAENLKAGRKELSMMVDMGPAVEGAFAGIGMAIGGLIAGTVQMSDIFSQAVLGLASLLIDLGQQFIAAGIAASTFFVSLTTNPLAAVAAGVALVAAGAVIKGLSTRMQGSPPALAKGGLAFGPTMAMVGDNQNASVDPEVIAPLSKLQSMMGGQSVQVTGKISGRDILLTSERNAIDRNRVRGF